MESELERLSSYRTRNFQSSKKLTPSHMARLGFYLEEGNIRCMKCAFAVSAVDTEDMNSFVRCHQEASPACSTKIDNVSANSLQLLPCDLISFEANLTESDTLASDSTDYHFETVHHNFLEDSIQFSCNKKEGNFMKSESESSYRTGNFQSPKKLTPNKTEGNMKSELERLSSYRTGNFQLPKKLTPNKTEGNMKSELERLSSFRTWNFLSSKKLTPSHLARLGFYLEVGNICCMNCAFAVSAVDTEDMNLFVRRHQDASPACSLEINNVSVNSPLLAPCDLIKSFEANSSYSTESDTLAIDSTNCHVQTVHHNLDVHETKELIEILKNSFQRALYHGLFGNNNATFRKDFDRKNPDFAALQNEMTRLWTFYDWPADVPAKPDVLAKAGFFYAGEIDIVRCAFCKGCLRNWVPEDVPIEEHRKHFPDCSFVNNAENSNILGKFQASRSLEKSCSVNATAQQQSTAATLRENDGWNHSAPPPRHPHMADETKRVESFTGKIVPRGQSVKILANAGFFNVGPQDNVKCFYCDGGLKNWQPSDDPWHEHARWFPRCKYLQSQRNADFIRVIQEKYQQTQTALLQQNLAQAHSSTNLRIGTNNQWIANNESAVTYHVEPREVKARMDTATVRAVIAMGYSRQLVRQVIQKQLVETGDDFSSAESLVEAIIEEQERADQAVTAIAQQMLSQRNGAPLTTSSEYQPLPNPAPSGIQLPGASTSVYVTTGESASAMSNNGGPSSSQLDKSAESSQKSSAKAAKKRNKKKKNRPNQTLATAPEDSTKNIEKKDKEAETEEYLEQQVENEEEMAGLGEEFLESDPRVLLEENRKLIEAKICNICMDAERNIVFLPCGHLVCCSTCAPEFRTCPICRSMIRGTVRTFLS